MSEGVTGSDGGGGRLIKVGALDIATICRVLLLVEKVMGRARSSLSGVMASEAAVHQSGESQQSAWCSRCLTVER
jgi:hypothetical protein